MFGPFGGVGYEVDFDCSFGGDVAFLVVGVAVGDSAVVDVGWTGLFSVFGIVVEE